MEKSICSALTGGDRVEIIIVDDGSSDNTLQIAKKYEEKFPNIVRVIPVSYTHLTLPTICSV